MDTNKYMYHKMWLHVSTNYMIILRPLMHLEPKLQFQISFLLFYDFYKDSGMSTVTCVFRFSCTMPLHEGCPESRQPFLISLEPVGWPSCNLRASKRRPYWASVNSRTLPAASQSAVRRCWLKLCTVWQFPLRNDRASRSASSQQCACPFCSSRAAFFFGKASHHSGFSAPLPTTDLAPGDFWLHPKLNSPLKGKRFVNATVTQYTSSVNGVSLPTD